MKKWIYIFIGALTLFVLCVGGGLLHTQRVKEQSARELAETQERIKQWNARQQQQPMTDTEVPVVEQSAEGGHVQGGWHIGRGATNTRGAP